MSDPDGLTLLVLLVTPGTVPTALRVDPGNYRDAVEIPATATDPTASAIVLEDDTEDLYYICRADSGDLLAVLIPED